MEGFLKKFDQYAGVWVGVLVTCVVVMGLADKFLVRYWWDSRAHTWRVAPLFPTPDWWSSATGAVPVLIAALLAKLGARYYVDSRYNSPAGLPPDTASSR